ncbi:hypothetical protein [Clostridium hydrogeniformans]|uniref:hypothetical protein n=1 Tax=Clostridium hydrogeniformans TaxID=349933 RepID=UPI000A88B743|nr:hypothetical protein [Clostridium hydrogeniformans]
MKDLKNLKERLKATDKELVEALGILIEDVRGNFYRVTHEELLDKLEQSLETLRRC